MDAKKGHRGALVPLLEQRQYSIRAIVSFTARVAVSDPHHMFTARCPLMAEVGLGETALHNPVILFHLFPSEDQ